MGWHSVYDEDDAERRRWQNPEAILREIGLSPGQTFVDIGCGDGFFSFPAARMVGISGKVYGLDVDSEVIKRIAQRADEEGLTNLILAVGKAEQLVLCEACADFAFFGIVLHDFDEPSKVLMNAKRMLKPDGCLIDVDWRKESMELGPPFAIRFSEQQTVSLLERAGFMIDVVKKSGVYHYMVVARKHL